MTELSCNIIGLLSCWGHLILSPPRPTTCVFREGHTSLVKELEEDMSQKPGAVVLSVGGGGLLNGVVEGLRRAGWDDVPIVAMETVGAHSLNAAVKAGELVTLPEITR